MVQRGGDRWVEGDEAAWSRHRSDIDDRLREAACEGRSQVGGGEAQHSLVARRPVEGGHGRRR